MDRVLPGIGTLPRRDLDKVHRRRSSSCGHGGSQPLVWDGGHDAIHGDGHGLGG